MGTTRNPLAGRYFNDPNIAAGLSNLAAAYGPPSADEYMAAEQYKGLTAQNARLAEVYALAGGDPDKMAIAADLYDPSNSFYAVDSANATSRFNNAADNTQSGLNNTADNQRLMDLGVLGVQGDVAQTAMDPNGRNSIPTEMLEAIFGPGMGEMPLAMPVMPTETQVAGGLLQRGADLMTDEQIAAMAFGTTPTTNVVGPDGNPVVSTAFGALGQEAFMNPGSEAAPKAILLVDPNTGEKFSGVFKNGQYFLGDGTPAPTHLIPQDLSKATGTDEEVGGGTTSGKTRYATVKATIAEGTMLVQDLRDLIGSQPAAAGTAGSLLSFGQDLIQTGKELAAAFGDNPNAPVSQDMLDTLADMGGNYDPTYRQIRTSLFQLAYMNATLNNPSGEVGQLALQRELEALGQGLVGNDQSVLAALDAVERNMRRKGAAIEALIGKAPGAVPPINTVDPGSAVPRSAVTPGTVLRFDADGNLVP